MTIVKELEQQVKDKITRDKELRAKADIEWYLKAIEEIERKLALLRKRYATLLTLDGGIFEVRATSGDVEDVVLGGWAGTILTGGGDIAFNEKTFTNPKSLV